jgi:DNA-binding IclR family transcriptional regulator
MELCGLNGDQATRLLSRLVEEGAIRKSGERRWSVYEAVV